MPTIRDVAVECGVSVSTVSNVMTGADRPVSDRLRKRVLHAAAKMNYHPNAMAQALVRKRANVIGVLSTIFGAADIVTNRYAAGVMAGVLEASASAGQNIILFTQPWRGAALSMPTIRDRRADGLILIAPPTTTDIVQAVAGSGTPLVTVAALPEPGVPTVDVDDAYGLMLAVECLVGLGHVRIAYIHGNMDMASAQIRLQAYIGATVKQGVVASAGYVVGASYNGEGGAEALRILMRKAEPPTAIIAGNDDIACAVLLAAAEMGISIPQDLSLIGYDDTIIASLTQPPLTTIRQPLAQIGALATNLLLERIDKGEVANTVNRLKPELVVRGTTMAAPTK